MRGDQAVNEFIIEKIENFYGLRSRSSKISNKFFEKFSKKNYNHKNHL